MDALMENGSMRVDLNRCIGCGLCVSTCPEGAVSLTPEAGVEAMPANYLNMLSRMARKRGVGFGKLDPLMRLARVPLVVKALPYLYKTGLARPIVDRMAKHGWV
jgi:Fe-S-cluster-containing hydrogenase component 2